MKQSKLNDQYHLNNQITKKGNHYKNQADVDVVPRDVASRGVDVKLKRRSRIERANIEVMYLHQDGSILGYDNKEVRYLQQLQIDNEQHFGNPIQEIEDLLDQMKGLSPRMTDLAFFHLLAKCEEGCLVASISNTYHRGTTRPDELVESLEEDNISEEEIMEMSILRSHFVAVFCPTGVKRIRYLMIPIMTDQALDNGDLVWHCALLILDFHTGKLEYHDSCSNADNPDFNTPGRINHLKPRICVMIEAVVNNLRGPAEHHLVPVTNVNYNPDEPFPDVRSYISQGDTMNCVPLSVATAKYTANNRTNEIDNGQGEEIKVASDIRKELKNCLLQLLVNNEDETVTLHSKYPKVVAVLQHPPSSPTPFIVHLSHIVLMIFLADITLTTNFAPSKLSPSLQLNISGDPTSSVPSLPFN
ncbi:hypothetical protein L596_030127 [Steinernema carpocapsae]|uniref:Uncharacterized protein n=1 Tax=Steinernema carpocapsae TaxID=34508 RepID=A0A4U5LRT6_STECR|nr:hypothetical protein L596_030127 [Steinernema carpocapsae]